MKECEEEDKFGQRRKTWEEEEKMSGGGKWEEKDKYGRRGKSWAKEKQWEENEENGRRRKRETLHGFAKSRSGWVDINAQATHPLYCAS